jgi:hypothetical protein
MRSNKGPIFIVGARRSGTNLIRMILSNIKNLHVCQEDMNSIIELLSNIHYKLDLKRIREILGDTSSKRLVIKNHNLLRGDNPKFLLHYPKFYMIILMRDPRASYCSRKYGMIKDNNPLNTIEEYNMMLFNYLRWNRVFGKNIRLLRYEDLVTNPESVIKNVCKFIDEEYDDSYLVYNKNTNIKFRGIDKYNKRSNSSFYEEIKDKPLIYTNSIDKWIEKLSNTEINSIQEQCSDTLKFMRYDMYNTNSYYIEKEVKK